MRRLLLLIGVVAICASVLASCSGATPSTSSRRASGLRVVFISDQSVVLSGIGAEFQFTAKVEHQQESGVVAEAITWRSSAPDQVSVSSSGLATAHVALGSATIYASAGGAQSEAAQVAVAEPGPKTVLLPSTDVLAKDGASVQLRDTSQTGRIAVGDILVSGNRGGLLGKVTEVSKGPNGLMVSVVPSSLAHAFSKLEVHAKSAPVRAMLTTPNKTTKKKSSVRTSASFKGKATPYVLVDDSDDDLVDCTSSSGSDVSVTLSGPSVSVPVDVQLVADLIISGFSVSSFELAVQVTVPVTITTGSITLSASGTASATCDLDVPSLDVPSPVFVGPIEIDGVITPTASVDVDADAGGSITVAGPVVTDTASALDGIEYSSGAGWAPVETNTQSGPVLAPSSSSYDTTLSATTTPDFRVDVGVDAVLGDCDLDLCTTLAGVDLAFAEISGDLDFHLDSPLSDLASGYTGPVWGAGIQLSAGPEISLTGDLSELLSWIGLQPPDEQWNAFDDKIPLAGSPQPAVTVRPGTSGLTLSASVPIGFNGDKLEFVAIPSGASTGTVVATSTIDGTDATATWNPSSNWSGTVTALLIDDLFGAVGLPYASAPVYTSFKAPTPTTTTTSSTTTTTTNTTTTTTTTTPSASGSVSVSLAQPWTDAGIDLPSNKRISISATGSAYIPVFCPYPTRLAAGIILTPAGFPWNTPFPTQCHDSNPSDSSEHCPDYTSIYYPNIPAAGLPCFSLIGRIGSNGTPFEVGQGRTFSSQSGGELYLGYNTWYFGNTTGMYEAKVTVGGT
jgi:hypothetical protein